MTSDAEFTTGQESTADNNPEARTATGAFTPTQPRRRPPTDVHRDPRLSIADLFDETRARQLWDSLPEAHRQDRFGNTNMPTDYETVLQPRVLRPKEGVPERISRAVSFRGLPEPMVWELAWYVHQVASDGGVIWPGSLHNVATGLRRATTDGSAAARRARSITALSTREWEQEARLARMRLGGAAGAACETAIRQRLTAIQDRLVYGYHQGDWWRLNVWNPLLDSRIPRREHEPSGRCKANFSHLTTDWFREGVKWWLSVQLLNGTYVWTSVRSRIDHFKWFQWFIDETGCVGPHLVDDVRDLRPMMRKFAAGLRQHKVMVGPTKGKTLSPNGLRQPLITLELFYRFMVDNADEAATVLNEPRWLLLGSQHHVLFRAEDKPRLPYKRPIDRVLDDSVVNAIASGSEVLAKPKAEGGMGDLQAFHALMLQMRTGRRLNEILMMDYEPLSALLHLTPEAAAAAQAGDGFVARMDYQQTKVEAGQPASIPVDAEIVTIIRAQQAHARALLAARGAPEGTTPRYLFLRERANRLGQHPYAANTYHQRLADLTRRLRITDSAGHPVQISQTHAFRHTRATTLLNAGVPIHVVMRYFGHLSPAMTMHYAQTLTETAEREFLRFKKVTADGRTVETPTIDLYDLLHLDTRADRVLPNGWCALPPKQVCTKGNACLSCDKFVTDAHHTAELTRQLADTERLIEARQEQFTKRFGTPMPDDNIWLSGRRAETTALRKVLVALEDITVHADGTTRGLRGAGTPDRRPDLEGPAQ